MSNVIISPNMNLPVPIVGVEPGPDWAQDINSCMSAIDSHDHTSGQGVAITPAALNINADLPFTSGGSYYNATSLRSVRFNNNAANLSTASDLGCLYETNNDLYYNDGLGNQIRLTQNGTIAGTAGSITGLPSGTAGVAYTSLNGTYTFSQATSTAANLDAATLIIRYPGSYPTPSGNYIALRAPSTLATGYAFTLPTNTPASNNNYLTSSTSGAITYSTSNDVAQLVTRSTGTTVGVLGVALSASSGTFQTTSTSQVDITNLSITITTSGRPVFIGLIADGSGTANNFIAAENATSSNIMRANFFFYRGSTQLSEYQVQRRENVTTTGYFLAIPSSSLNIIDFPSAGTYTYKLRGSVTDASGRLWCYYSKLVAYEL